MQIAFSSVSITLRHYISDMASGKWHVHHGKDASAQAALCLQLPATDWPLGSL
jgi:hypothetical protein